MSQQELLRRVVRALDETGVAYMVTGSTASSLLGEPRATHDIDLVVAMEHSAAQALADAFPAPEYYLDEAAIHTAIDERGMFNLIVLAEGDKVDFWLLTEDAFDRSRFSRTRVEEVFGISLRIPSPEDVILAKLHWAKASDGSEKQLLDALRVYEVQSALLDRTYLDQWAEQLSVTDLWLQLQADAETL